MKKMNLVKKCSLALISIMLTAFLAACSNGSSSSSDSGSGGGGGSSSTGLKEGKAPAIELFATIEVPNDWDKNTRLELSAGSWEYLDVDKGAMYTEVRQTTFPITDTSGSLDCSSAKEFRLISLTDQQINDLKGADAEEELDYIKSSKGCLSYIFDKAYMDTKSKVLVLEKAITPTYANVGKGKELPLSYNTINHVKTDSTSNPTKYIVYFDSNGNSYYTFAKK